MPIGVDGNRRGAPSVGRHLVTDDAQGLPRQKGFSRFVSRPLGERATAPRAREVLDATPNFALLFVHQDVLHSMNGSSGRFPRVFPHKVAQGSTDGSSRRLRRYSAENIRAGLSGDNRGAPTLPFGYCRLALVVRPDGHQRFVEPPGVSCRTPSAGEALIILLGLAPIDRCLVVSQEPRLPVIL